MRRGDDREDIAVDIGRFAASAVVVRIEDQARGRADIGADVHRIRADVAWVAKLTRNCVLVTAVMLVIGIALPPGR